MYRNVIQTCKTAKLADRTLIVVKITTNFNRSENFACRYLNNKSANLTSRSEHI